jgi:hypothetical protein
MVLANLHEKGRNLGISISSIRKNRARGKCDRNSGLSAAQQAVAIKKQIEAGSHFRKLDGQLCPRCKFRFEASQLTPTTKNNKKC